jgi:hypothetical protein
MVWTTNSYYSAAVHRIVTFLTFYTIPSLFYSAAVHKIVTFYTIPSLLL